MDTTLLFLGLILSFLLRRLLSFPAYRLFRFLPFLYIFVRLSYYLLMNLGETHGCEVGMYGSRQGCYHGATG